MKSRGLSKGASIFLLIMMLVIITVAASVTMSLIRMNNSNPQPGDKVPIEARDRSDENLEFHYWWSELSDLEFGDRFKAKTYYIMPENHEGPVNVKAIYRAIEDKKNADMLLVPQPESTAAELPVVTDAPTSTPESTATPEPTAAPEPTAVYEPVIKQSPIYYVSFCEESISMRQYPSTAAAPMYQIPIGARVDYMMREKGDFIFVAYRGATGYVLKEYLLNSDYMPALPGEMLRVVNCEMDVSLRHSPYLDAITLDKIPLGDTVEFLGLSANEYAYVSYRGQTGYVLAYYLGL